MILQELCNLYDRLATDPESGIAPYGCVVQGVAFEIVIDSAGKLEAINDLRTHDGKKTFNKMMNLPGTAKPSGAGINPSLNGWDRTDYLLGYLNREELKPAEADKKLARCAELHAAYKQAMLEREPQVNHSDYSAFCRFLERWDSSMADHDPVLPEVSGSFGVVRLQGKQSYLHDMEAVAEYNPVPAAAAEEQGMCLISGKPGEIARIHDIKIKGVKDAQSSGANLVSFNCNSFESYGRSQSFNAPVSKRAAFKYATALNTLLARDSKRRLQIADATCVFWADAPSISEDLFGFVFSGEPPTDSALETELHHALQSLQRGALPEGIDADTAFYVLGLSPNAARISIRFWYGSTLGTMLRNISAFQQELNIIKGPKDRELLPFWLLLLQTARESADIPPLLGGAVMRAVLTGGRYPLSLYQAILRRIRADRDVNHPRAAVIKAVLLRNFQKEGLVMLDKERPEAGYQIGRLFAALERAQENAQGNLNAGIKDRYFASTSATPATVMPRLIRLSQHHIAKLEGGRKVNAEKLIQEICGRLDGFPAHLGLQEQGLFALGYYHQRQDFFSGNKQNNDPSDE